MAIARRLPRAQSTAVRLAVSNIHRPGALTPTVVLSLGLGLALLVTVTLIDGNLRRQFSRRPAGTRAGVLLPRHPAERRRTLRRSHRQARRPARTSTACRCCAAASSRPTASSAPRISKPPPQIAWVLQSDRGITYADKPPEGSRLVAGKWWAADYHGPAAGLAGEAHRRRPRPESRRQDHRQRARPQHHGRDRQPAHASTGNRSASTSCWSIRRTPFAARRIRHIATLDLSRTAAPPQQEVALAKSLAATFPGVTVVRVQGGDRGRRRPRRQPGRRQCAAPASLSSSRRCWCSAARSRPAIATASMKPSS